MWQKAPDHDLVGNGLETPC